MSCDNGILLQGFAGLNRDLDESIFRRIADNGRTNGSLSALTDTATLQTGIDRISSQFADKYPHRNRVSRCRVTAVSPARRFDQPPWGADVEHVQLADVGLGLGPQ